MAGGRAGGRASKAKPKMAAVGHPEAAGLHRGPRASTLTAQRHLTSFAEPHPHPPRGGLASPSRVAADWLRLWSLSASLLGVERARTRKVASAGPRMYAGAINWLWSPRRPHAPPSGLEGRAQGGEGLSTGPGNSPEPLFMDSIREAEYHLSVISYC